MPLRIQVPDVSREGAIAVFWGIYWAIAAGVVSLPFILGLLVLQLLPYSSELAYGLLLFSLILLISAGYGAFSIVVGEEARRRGYPWNLFFWLSIGLTPFLMGLIVANLPRKGDESALPRVCFNCQKPLLPEARFCSACGQRSPILVDPTGYDFNTSEPTFQNTNSDSSRTKNIVGGVGALLGSLLLVSLFFLARDFLLVTGEVTLQDLLYLVALGLGLGILGIILLSRGLRRPKA